MTNEPRSEDVKVLADAALRIAIDDASQSIADLTQYRIQIVLQDVQWQIDFEPQDPQAQGGGLHYTISATSGEVLSARFEQ